LATPIQGPIFRIFFPGKILGKIWGNFRGNFSPKKCGGKLEFSAEKVDKL
jgi:hypothetical protein